MRVKDFAESRGLTQGAVYKSVQRAGHSMKQLTNKKGELTPAGMKIILTLYPEDEYPEKKKPEEMAEALEEKNRVIDSLREELKETAAGKSIIDDLRARLREAQEQAEKWERLYLELQDRSAQERDAHREELRAAHVLAAQAQETISKLSMNPIRRLFSGRKKEPVDTEGEVK